MRYLFTAYGVESGGDVFAIPNCVIVGLSAPGQRPLTRIRRVPPHGTDIAKMEALNDLCRRLCGERPDLDEAWARLQAASSPRAQSPSAQLLAYFITTGAFCLFFGGTWADALNSGLCGLAIGLCLGLMERLGTNLFFKTTAGGFVCGLTASLLLMLGLGSHTDLIVTGAIMALVPGLVITNFMRDIIAGDMISGLSKLSEALLTGTGIALGTGLALSLIRMLGGVV